MGAVLRIASTTDLLLALHDFILHVQPMSRRSKVDCFSGNLNPGIYTAKEIN